MLDRAVELATQLDDDASLATALSALQTCRRRSGAFCELAKHAEEASRVAKRLADPILLAEATVWSAHVSLNAGEVLAARDTLDELLSSLGDQLPTWHQARTGNSESPAITARWSRGLVSLLLGHPDDAIARTQSALSIARSQGEPYSVSAAWASLATLHMLSRDAARMLECVREMIAFAASTQVPYEGQNAVVRALVCWATMRIDPVAGEEQVDELVPPSGWTGVPYRLPLIEVCAQTGRHARALEEIATGLAFAEENNLFVWVPEYLRLRGELLARSEPKEAERWVAQAIELAHGQSSKWFELRALTSLYRLQKGKGRAKTLGAIQRLYESFTEGFDKPDLVDARAILDAAQPRNN